MTQCFDLNEGGNNSQSVLEREKHREAEKVDPGASRLSDKAQLSKQSQLWGSEWEHVVPDEPNLIP